MKKYVKIVFIIKKNYYAFFLYNSNYIKKQYNKILRPQIVKYFKKHNIKGDII